MERKWVRILLWIAVIAVCGMIFFFSEQSGEESADTSGKVVQWLLAILIKGYHMLAAIQQQEIFETASLIVRKLAHFGEFALLGFLVRLLMRSYRVKSGGSCAWACSTLYALTDEMHQFFSDARGASLVDVGIDSLGAATGAAVASLLLWLFFKGRKERAANEETDCAVPVAATASLAAAPPASPAAAEMSPRRRRAAERAAGFQEANG